jgi:hypothetical protein
VGLGSKLNTPFAPVQSALERILGRTQHEMHGAPHRVNRDIGPQESRLFRGSNNETARSAQLVLVLAAEEW